MKIWQEISIENLQFNLNQIRQKVGKNVDVLAVIKANAYGHGADIIAPALEAAGVNFFGAAGIEEAIDLRDIGIKSNILLMGPLLEEELNEIINNNVIPTLSDKKTAENIKIILDRENKKIKIHVKIDTGMGRFGIYYKDALDFIEFVSRQKCFEINGIYSHFSSADFDSKETEKQLNIFLSILRGLEEKEIYIPYKHIANSSAIINLENSYFNMVRSGLLLYGISPIKNSAYLQGLELRPVMQWKTRLVFKKNIPGNHGVSYGQSYITPQKQNIGIIPVGYKHGLDRNLSNKGFVLIKGKQAPIIGAITMDYTIINLSDIPLSKIGDEVVIIGSQEDNKISVEQLSAKTGRLPYEVLCNISDKIEKLAIKNRTEIIYHG